MLGSGRGTRAALALICAAAVVVGGGAIPAAAAPSTSAHAGTGRIAVKTALASQRAVVKQAVSAASSAAVSSGVPVVVDALTSSTQQTSALPDGTMQLEVSSVPVRVEQDGAWVPVDTSLVADGEWLAPAASAAPVRFSAGGSDELAQVQTESGEWVTETWPYGDLPKPTIEGDTATYAEVLPGVDLKMTATSTGQASVYVVKTESAAQSATLDDLHVLIGGADLTTTSSGIVEAEAADGSDIIAGQPLWWDSSEGATFRDPGDIGSPAPVTHDVAADRISMDVGESVEKEETRTGGDVTYPIYVDPDWASGIAASWYTDAAFPGTSYLSGNSPILRVGNYQQYKSDMFFQFPIGALAGKLVTYAVLNTTQLSMDACGTPGAIQVHTYGPKPAGFTWNQEQAWNADGSSGWSTALQSWVGPGCGSAPTAVGWNVTGGVQGKIGASDIQFAFTPSNPSAPTRRHYDRAATLIVTYNTRPDTPTNPVFTSPNAPCGTANNPVRLAQTDLTVQVNQTDSDGGNVDTNFFLMRAADLNTLVQHRAPGLGAQGPKSVTFNGLADGETYAWYARGSDWIHDGSGATSWCYFTVDVTKPALPVVATQGTISAFRVGQPVNLTIAPAQDVAGYVWWVTPTQRVSPAPAVPVEGLVKPSYPSPSAPTQLCWSNSTPTVVGTVRRICANNNWTYIQVAPTDSLSTVWISAYDRAGNQSAATGFALHWASPASSAVLDAGHAWHLSSMTSPLPNSIPDSNPWIGSNAISLVVPPGRSTSTVDLPDPPAVTPVLSTSGPGTDPVGTAVAPVDARNSFTFSAWVKGRYTGSGTAPQKIAVQGGGTVGTVQLQVTPSGAISFCLGADGVSAMSTDATSNCATGGALTGQWQLVTGIWDASNEQLRLHIGNDMNPVAINGHKVATGTGSAGGPLVFGPGAPGERWEGLISNPVIVPGVIDHTQLSRLAAFELPFSD